MQAILVLNAGSSSLKFKIFVKTNNELNSIASGSFTRTNSNNPLFKLKIQQREFVQDFEQQITMPQMLNLLDQALKKYLPELHILAIGHRVVHGGDLYTSPTIVDQTVIDGLKSIIYLTPIHMPHNIAPMEVCASIFADIPQVACFDTAFHSSIPKVNYTYALPKDFAIKNKIRRYGFHGLSYEYLTRKLFEIAPKVAKGKVIMCHLGAGASICAVENGKSINTTMGLTPLEGLVMGTRCGSIDPAIVLYLMQEGYSYKEIEDILYFKSGLLGISGTTADFQAIAKSNEVNEIEAFDIFVESIIKNILMLSGSLQGINGLVFSGGIGENGTKLRQKVLTKLNWLGLEFNEEANNNGETLISTEDSTVDVFVIPTEEELAIANHVIRLLGIEQNDASDEIHSSNSEIEIIDG